MEDLNNVHPQYNLHLELWKYLHDSSVGGQTYRDGNYLHMYHDEAYTTTYYSTVDDNANSVTLPQQVPVEGGNPSYKRRKAAVEYVNHPRMVLDIYQSMVFKTEPTRKTESLTNPFIDNFIKDADRTGQGLTSCMKNLYNIAAIYGNAWAGVDSPNLEGYDNNAQRIDGDVRPYLTMYAPTKVIDWKYAKRPNGVTYLCYVKIIEAETSEYYDIVEWTEETITRHRIKRNESSDDTTTLKFGEPIGDPVITANPVYCVPFINIMLIKDMGVPGLGHSVIEGVAGKAREIYNLSSELEQTVRISTHPTLVVETGTQYMAGVGATIEVDKNSTIQPSLLQPSGASGKTILEAIEFKTDEIYKMSHLDSVVGLKTQPMSGVALEVSRENLTNRLTDYADTLEEAEMNIWKLFAKFEQIELPEDFVVEYNKSYNVRDSRVDLDNAYRAAETINEPAFWDWYKEFAASHYIEDDNKLADILAKFTSVSDQPDVNNNGTNDSVADADDRDQSNDRGQPE